MNKSQLKIVSVVLAVILLVTAFMSGVMGIMDDLDGVRKSQSEFDSFNTMLTTMSECDRAVTDGKAEYDTRKAKLDADTEAYEKELNDLAASEKKFNEDVLGYNTQLLEYSAGKDALSAGGSAFTEGKKQLEQGWAAYNAGKEAFEQGKKDAAEKLKAYEQGKAAYEDGLKQYEEGLAGYNQLMEGIEKLESMLIPHRLALIMISAQAGMKITDESIAEMKSGLDAAKVELDKAKAQFDAADAMMPDAEKQMQDAEKQLNDTKAMLEKGQKELDSAEAQYEAGKKRIDDIGSSIGSTQAELGKASSELEAKRTELDARKEALDAEAKELSEYESAQETLRRRRETLIDEGFGTAADTNEALMAAASVRNDELHGDYMKTLVSYIVTYGTHLLSVAAAVIALAILKKKLRPSLVLAIVSVALGAVGLVASIIFGNLDTLAFAAAVFTLAGVGLTEHEEEA